MPKMKNADELDVPKGPKSFKKRTGLKFKT